MQQHSKSVPQKQKPISQMLQQQSMATIQHLSLNMQQKQNEDAYEQLMQNWRKRQKQQLSNRQLQTLYQYDIHQPDFQAYRKPVSQDRQDIFLRYLVEICKYLNAKYIVEQIIQPILQYKLLDQNILHNVEFLYLLSFRAWCEINCALKPFNQKKVNRPNTIKNIKRKQSIQKMQFVFASSDMNLKYLVDPMIKLSMKIDNLFNQYHKLLTQRQSKIKNTIQAFFDFVFHRKDKNIRDKFMCGFQGIDFNREQQINYLKYNYITVLIEQLKNKAGLKYENLIKRLLIFRELLLYKIERMDGYDDYQILKKKLIKQKLQIQKQKAQILAQTLKKQ